MRLTSMTDYAIRLLMYVACHPGRLCTIGEIAQAYHISEPHLMKITNRLSQCGWIETVRGRNGGMRLARTPTDIRLGAVMRDTETDFELVECFGPGSTCTLTGQCRLTGIIDGALRAFLRHMDDYTLADILPAASYPIFLDTHNATVSQARPKNPA
ncbi:MAG TPA: Rrf2 family transcriptional regulator [Burkholderiaceae bacterium]|nr:Rrf2 family transcriptional regulator [Burkholderiaceae bacterium]